MSRIATRYIDYHNLTPKMSIAKLSHYAEELVKILKDAKARDHARNWIQKLGFSKDQTYALIPNQTSGRHVTGRDLVKKLALYIKENETNLEPEQINELAYNLAKTGPTDIAQSSLLKLLRKELRQLNANYIALEAIYVPDITRASNKEQERRQEHYKDGDVNVHPINNFLIPYGISSSLLRKIGSDHAIIIHEALRHKINREASDHYGIMNNRPNTPAPKQENSEVEDIIDLYGEISDDED
ncbi:6696_t:CDS:2 [Entrophospora sp. SA101]|nr:6696_t:CDS:2 [Entrophospora sp. SA101]